MKSQSIYSLLLLCVLTFTRFLTITAKSCVDFPNPLNPSEKVIVECPPTANTYANVKRETTNFFQVNHTCYSTTAMCDKIKEAYNDAGKEISKTLKLKQIIYVNSTFIDFLDITLLGATSVARTIKLISDDKITRYYPQALVKQFSFDPHPEYSDFDIISSFNAGQEWWFRTDNETIKSNQYDFYAVLLHELMHGLGFVPGWGNALETSDNQNTTGLTPNLDFTGGSEIEFAGFTENIFDKFVKTIINNTVNTLTYYTYQLNEAIPIGTPFNNYSEFVTKMKSSPQWKYAEFALISATTNDSSSINHVSDEKYEPTEDFLMTWSFNPGETLEYLIQKGGNYKSPIGPRLLSILESMGYETEAYPNSIKPTYEY
ncbi:hypothetical protein Glove_553g57 [Diversispora epigaea]|uniref:Sequence orphan n=1 Tax=Diversispora epigaea TaxID=1348612 RepID=A0A397GB98_9GLOM|nr:hypothetical protein Glove_553g57 [Diversispora epigaea]